MGERIESHRDLRVWKQTYELALSVLRVAGTFPKSEQFALTSQCRRSAISIPSNIAEGYGRGSTMDYLRFLKIARGSLFELDTQLLIAADLGYLSPTDAKTLQELWTDCSKMLSGLIRSLEK